MKGEKINMPFGLKLTIWGVSLLVASVIMFLSGAIDRGEEKTTDYNQCYREYIKCEKQR